MTPAAELGALLGSVAAASFLGSLHCVGMCGPLVGAYVGVDTHGRRAALASHGLYQLGRLATLLVAGAVAGALGSGIDVLGQQAGIQRVVAGLAGALMIVWGVASLTRGPLQAGRLGRAVAGRLSGLVARAGREPRPLRRALLLGAATPLLPCGWLYLYVLAAAGAGHPGAGAAVLATFWAGNVPALLGAGLGLQTVLRRLRPRLPALSAAVLIVMGALLLVQRTQPLTLPRLRSASLEAEPACCQGEPSR